MLLDMKRRVSARAIIEHEGKILLVQLKPYPGSIVLDEPYWCTIGGGIDEGESLVPALKREVMEETGVQAKVGNLLYIQQFVNSDKEQMELFFHVTNTQDFMDIDLSKASHAEEEIERIEFVDPKSAHILPKFLSEVNIAEDIATQSPTKIFSYIP